VHEVARHTGAVTAAVDAVGTDEALDTSVALVADRDRIATIAGFGRAGELGIKLLGGGPGADPGTAVREAARAQLAELASDGTLDVRVSRTYPLSDAAQAHRDGQAGHSAGKLVLVP
jgi:NADPH:quinone reductase-like Zn-dependent oxidoreductase